MEELPYVVWYQCRMCTHIFLDDIEKMFTHLEKRHGAMIDCEELREVVSKNGLSLGGLSSPAKLKDEQLHEETDKDVDNYAALPRPRYIEDEGGIGDNETVLVVAEDDVSGAYVGQNGDYAEDTFEDPDYPSGGGVELKYNYNVNDDEEQLPEDDPDLNLNVFEEDYQNGHEEEEEVGDIDDEQYMHEDDDDVEIDAELHDGLSPSVTFIEGEEYNEEDYYDDDEEGEIITEEQSFNDEDDELEELEMGEVSQKIHPKTNRHNSRGEIADDDQQLLNGFGYSCKFCGKFFTTRRGVETHEQHHKTQSAPTSAIRRRPNEPRLYPCKMCKRKYFQSFKDLKAHVKTHTPERIHICKFCCSTFNNTASLTKHLNIHKRENPNKCFCGKTFVSANTLKIHKKIHTGIKPFVCEFRDCGRAFVTKSTLESHLRTHTGEKPYRCSACPSSFTTSSAKYRHERHVHKVLDPNGME